MDFCKFAVIKEILISWGPAFIALLGVILSIRASTGKTSKALKNFENNLRRELYIYSKRADMEFELFRMLSRDCSEIYELMQKLIPDSMVICQISRWPFPNASDLNDEIAFWTKDLAQRIVNLENDIDYCRPFISQNILDMYTNLAKSAKDFFNAEEKYTDCKSSPNEKEQEDVAYNAKQRYKEGWEKTGNRVREYIEAKEKIESLNN